MNTHLRRKHDLERGREGGGGLGGGQRRVRQQQEVQAPPPPPPLGDQQQLHAGAAVSERRCTPPACSRATCCLQRASQPHAKSPNTAPTARQRPCRWCPSRRDPACLRSSRSVGSASQATSGGLSPCPPRATQRNATQRNATHEAPMPAARREHQASVTAGGMPPRCAHPTSWRSSGRGRQ